MSRAVILTSLSVEYLPVHNHLSGLREKTHPQDVIYERVSFDAKERILKVSLVKVNLE